MGHFRKQLALEIRRRRGDLTLRDFAKKLGMSKTTIQRIENEQQNITIDTIEMLCDALKCEVNELLGQRQ